MKKYELTEETSEVAGLTLHRIKAVAALNNISAGELGGFIEKEENLSQYGNAWVYGNAKVYGDAKVCGNAKVCGDAKVYGNAEVCGDAKVYGNAWVYGNAEVYGNAKVCGDAEVYGDAEVCGNAEIRGDGHLITIGTIGSRNSYTTFFRDKSGGISVKCGCFCGNIDEFLEKVSDTHRDNHHAKTYRAAAELARIHIGPEESGGEL